MSSTVHLISRIKPLKISTLPPSAVVRPAPTRAVSKSKPPVRVVDVLAAQNGPKNLRVEEFRNERRDWVGVKPETREALMKALREK